MLPKKDYIISVADVQRDLSHLLFTTEVENDPNFFPITHRFWGKKDFEKAYAIWHQSGPL